MTDSAYMKMINFLPRKRFGRVVRRAAGWEGANLISNTAVRLYARAFSVAVDEAEYPIDHYPNISSFFTRRLKAGARPIAQDADALISPVDGVVSEFGVIDHDWMTQVKGKQYRVQDLLGSDAQCETYRGGHYMTIYLSPRHYHRIHSPVEGQVTRYDHIPGELFPVNGPSVRSVANLFAINERLTSYIDMGGKQELALVKVGAVGVGYISVRYADRVTNLPNQVRQNQALNDAYPVARGQELATFELGSTVILVAPPGALEFAAEIQAGQEVKMGQKIGRVLCQD